MHLVTDKALGQMETGLTGICSELLVRNSMKLPMNHPSVAYRLMTRHCCSCFDDVTSGIPVDVRMPRYEVREKTLPDGLLSILQIFSVQNSDFATYSCSAYNAYNSTYLPIKFSKEGTSFNFVVSRRIVSRRILCHTCFRNVYLLTYSVK